MALNLHHLRLFAAVVDHGRLHPGRARAAISANRPSPSHSTSWRNSFTSRCVDRSGKIGRAHRGGKDALRASERALWRRACRRTRAARAPRAQTRDPARRRQHHDRHLPAPAAISAASRPGIPACASEPRARTHVLFCAPCSSSESTSRSSRGRFPIRASMSFPGCDDELVVIAHPNHPFVGSRVDVTATGRPAVSRSRAWLWNERGERAGVGAPRRSSAQYDASRRDRGDQAGGRGGTWASRSCRARPRRTSSR